METNRKRTTKCGILEQFQTEKRRQSKFNPWNKTQTASMPGQKDIRQRNLSLSEELSCDSRAASKGRRADKIGETWKTRREEGKVVSNCLHVHLKIKKEGYGDVDSSSLGHHRK